MSILLALFATEPIREVVVAVPSDAVQIANIVVTAFVGIVGSVISGYIAIKMAALNKNQAETATATTAAAKDAKKAADEAAERDREAARKAEEVKKTLAAVSVVTAKKVDAVAEAVTNNAHAVATKTEEVKAALAEAEKIKNDKLDVIATKLDDNTVKTEETRKLVNGGFSSLLSEKAVLATRIADLTKNPEDIAAAALATKKLAEHENANAAANLETPRNLP